MYDAVHEALLSGDTAIQAAKFKEKYAELCEPDPQTGKTKLAKQFEVSIALKLILTCDSSLHN